MKIKVDIFSGFLGAGKTRLIKKLIEGGYYKEKVAIIENEFGEVSIDGTILKNTNTVVTEITSGCICCQVTGDFKNSIIDVVKNYDVQRLIIEPTGVAKLSDLKKVFEDEDLELITEIDKLITVVDSEKFDIYNTNFKNFFIDQIRAADIIVLSRVQKVDTNIIKKLNKTIQNINSRAIIIDKEWDKVKASELVPIKNIINKKEEIMKFQRADLKARGFSRENELAGEVFQTFAIDFEKKVSKVELMKKFQFISNSIIFGKIIRAKGIVTMSDGSMGQFDFSLNEFSIEKVNYSGKPVISFIGTNLNREEIERFFK